MKKNRALCTGAIAAVVMALAATYFFVSEKPSHSAFFGSDLVVRRGDIEDAVTALGKLEPATYVDVGAQVSGQLDKLHVDIGSVVKKGDLVAEIDPRTMMAKVEADKATLINLEATRAEREARLAQAHRNYTRDMQLKKENATSELVAQTSETEYKIAQAQLRANEAQIMQAQATLNSNELNLSYSQIYAPISGSVVTLDVKEGQTLNANQIAPKLMRIAMLDIMTVRASVSEADINKISPGMDVYFTTVGDSSTRYYGKVEKALPSYTELNDVIMYDVIFNVENPDRIFLPAMNAQVFFIKSQLRDVLYLPIEAIPPKRDAGGNVLTAQDSVLSSDNNLIQSRLERLNIAIALFKALGGGWGNQGNMDTMRKEFATAPRVTF